jgi:hypothetical protein
VSESLVVWIFLVVCPCFPRAGVGHLPRCSALVPCRFVPTLDCRRPSTRCCRPWRRDRGPRRSLSVRAPGDSECVLMVLNEWLSHSNLCHSMPGYRCFGHAFSQQAVARDETNLGWLGCLPCLTVGLSTDIMFGATVGLGKVDAQILPEWTLPLWVITAGVPCLSHSQLTTSCILPQSRSSVYAFTVLYNPALTVTKVSILMLYYRMSQARPFFRYATLTVGPSSSSMESSLPSSTSSGVIPSLVHSRRRQLHALMWSPSTFAQLLYVLTDIAILVIPLPMVTAMRLGVRQKVGLVATFMLGVFWWTSSESPICKRLSPTRSAPPSPQVPKAQDSE